MSRASAPPRRHRGCPDSSTRPRRAAVRRRAPPSDLDSAASVDDPEMGPRLGPRLEDGIELSCCGLTCRLVGNLALRGAAGSDDTRLAYECKHCHRRLQVVDDWGKPDADQLAIFDETP